MSIRKIDVNIGTVPKWGDDDFDEKVHDNFSKLDQVIPKINETVGDIDLTVALMNVTEKNTLTYKQNAKDSQDAAQQSASLAQQNANIATQKALEVQGFQFPTGVTYTPTEVDNKIEEKALESFLGFNF